MDFLSVDAMVLRSVNAPYEAAVDVSHLLSALKSADSELPQLQSFFCDVPVHLLIEFCLCHGLSPDTLQQQYKSFLFNGGRACPLFERSVANHRIVRQRAIEVFEDERKANRWLNAKLALLGHLSPAMVVDDDPERILNILERIAWGVPP